MAKFWLPLLLTLPPALAEPGCPVLEKGSVGICLEECATSADCETSGKPGHLCCPNGCGHVCIKPASGAAGASTAKAYEIMAVLRDGAAASTVKGVVPPPLSMSELRSVKVLTLQYRSSQEACQAFQKLQSLVGGEVKSAEWADRAPNCAESEL